MFRPSARYRKSGASPSLGYTSVPLRTFLVRSALLASRPRWGLNRQSRGHSTGYSSTPAFYIGITTPLHGSHPRCAPRPRTTSRPVSVVNVQLALDRSVPMNMTRPCNGALAMPRNPCEACTSSSPPNLCRNPSHPAWIWARQHTFVPTPVARARTCQWPAAECLECGEWGVALAGTTFSKAQHHPPPSVGQLQEGQRPPCWCPPGKASKLRRGNSW